jgi:F420-dependent oxidoreductase-like protein
MELRIMTEPQQGATYDELLAVARCAETAGFDGFFRSDHYLSMGDGDGRPGPTDAWTTLAGLARETSTLRLGTMVSPVTFRHPGPLAVTVAQVDQMSGGRVELGLGTGWFEQEHEAFGLPFPPLGERFELLEEQLQILRGLWAGERFDFTGKHYQLVGNPALAVPVQHPLPIIVGGGGPKRTPRLAATYADEFNIGFRSLADSAAALARVREACRTTGRDLTLSVAHAVAVGRDEAEVGRRIEATGHDPDELRADALVGTPSQVVDRIGRYAEAGATRFYLQVMDLHDLEHLELIAEQVAPQL